MNEKAWVKAGAHYALIIMQGWMNRYVQKNPEFNLSSVQNRLRSVKRKRHEIITCSYLNNVRYGASFMT